MKTKRLSPLILIPLFLLAACGGKDSETPPPAAAGPGSEKPAVTEETGAPPKKEPTSATLSEEGPLFEREVTRRACDFLSPGDVAAVAGVDVAEIDQRSMGGMCLYSWDGGNATLGHMRTHKTVRSARSGFESSYRSHTSEEVEDSMQQVQSELEKQAEEGETTIDPEQAKLVAGAISGVFAGGLQFEPIPGLGDMAAFETTRNETQFGGKTIVSYANALAVLTGNLKFSVSFARDGEPQLYREENIALARAALKRLNE